LICDTDDDAKDVNPCKTTTRKTKKEMFAVTYFIYVFSVQKQSLNYIASNDRTINKR